MIIAFNRLGRVDARWADRPEAHICPGCEQPVVLHRGTKVIAHFKHAVARDCLYATGETVAHLDAKALVHAEFSRRGTPAELEKTVDTLPGDRRADVMVTTPGGGLVAFELQHSPIDPRDIAARAEAYARADVAQLWIPFLSQKAMEGGVRTGKGLRVAGYRPRPFELWLHRFHEGHAWMYAPPDGSFWRATLAPHMLYQEYRVRLGEGGEEISSGGYEYAAKDMRDLSLEGPYRLEQLLVRRSRVPDRRAGPHRWPEATVATLHPRDSAS